MAAGGLYGITPCPHPVGYFTHKETGKRYPAACRRWDCPVCGPVKKNILLDRMSNGMSIEKQSSRSAERAALEFDTAPAPRRKKKISGFYCRMLTLTLQEGDRQNIMKAYNRFRSSMAKRGFHWAYGWTKEFMKNGTRHLHIYVDTYLPARSIYECWKMATGNPRCIKPHICRFDAHNPAAYMAKYITKEFLEGEGFKPKEHRFGFSRHDFWRLPQRISSGLWSYYVYPGLMNKEQFLNAQSLPGVSPADKNLETLMIGRNCTPINHDWAGPAASMDWKKADMNAKYHDWHQYPLNTKGYFSDEEEESILCALWTAELMNSTPN